MSTVLITDSHVAEKHQQPQIPVTGCHGKAKRTASARFSLALFSLALILSFFLSFSQAEKQSFIKPRTAA